MKKLLHSKTRKNYFLKFALVPLLLFAFATISNAQTLMHSYTFNGNANDGTGSANGSLSATGATFSPDGKINLNDGYLTFDAGVIDVPSYTSITFEVVFNQTAGQTGFHTLLAFGTQGSLGSDYVQLQPARADDVLRAAISCNNTTNPWATETGINDTSEITDEDVHHSVITITADEMALYLDGTLIGTTALAGDNVLSNIGNTFASLGYSTYMNDPLWSGSIDEFNIYSGAMDATTVSSRAASFLGGTNANLATLTVSPGTLTPTFDAGVISYGVSVPAGTTSVNISATTEDGSATINSGVGTLTLTDGEGTASISVTASDGITTKTYNLSIQEECFMPLGANNLVPDPYCADRSVYQGWGSVSVTNDLAETYCGGASLKLGNGGSGCDAALDINPATFLQPETTYRVRVMVKTVDGNIGFRVSAADPTFDYSIDTNGVWELQDFTFTTGAGATTDGFISFNKCDSASNATYTYIDNFEIYDMSTLSADDFELNNVAFKLYPNPSTNNVFKIALNDFDSAVNVKVFNLLGKEVINKDFVSNSKTIEVNHKLNAGIYIVKINDSATSKLIVK
ncbi:hypothetical protein PK35_02615 [Tamlana nanhaiensis]|uniref:Cadherin-like beta sandwich domain-containing protein n=1 Tax=Neotamlana nanhaiensis TaxID=1382798 RepID=A0A0D7W7K5_9FLAO|nr:LamG-like jellyroll fold domain-containing protein [Tamlana nanhaiensis]KJD34678.1 hypothetical protein PK35_02615 [Tamlana nanhaiensis]